MDHLFTTAISYIATIILLFLVIAYLYVKHLYGYWNRRKIFFIRPTFPFGNFADVFLQRRSMGEVIRDLYNDTKSAHRFVGIFSGLNPTICVNDPKIIQDVMITNFNNFPHRGTYSDEKRDPLTFNLFHMQGDMWKNLRQKLTPTFTSGKLKSMFPTMLNCGVPLKRYMDNVMATSGQLEVRELMACYSTDIIAATAFGIDVNSIENPDVDFRQMGRKFFGKTVKKGLQNFLVFAAPSLQKIFHFKIFADDIEAFIIDLVKNTLEYREKNNVARKDFFQLLIQLRNTGTVNLDGKWETVIIKGESNKRLTINQLAAQVFIFYAAGFETSSTTISFCLYELSKNEDIQKKVQDEIHEVLSRHNGEITFDSLNDMKYLEACIDETLRYYPPVPVLHRLCNKTYNILGTDDTIEPGTTVVIPVWGIHHDPKYFPNPSLFDPTRFSKENVSGKSFTDMPNLPFGEGPRNCIGSRMGQLQTKTGLVIMLKDFSYELDTTRTSNEIKYYPGSFITTPVGGIHLKVTNRKQ